jgi:hypothetical protein
VVKEYRSTGHLYDLMDVDRLAGRVLVLVGQTELGKLRDASRKAESALKAAEKLKASLAKVKASRKALEMQIKRQNPLTPLDLILTDELVVRHATHPCTRDFGIHNNCRTHQLLHCPFSRGLPFPVRQVVVAVLRLSADVSYPRVFAP